MTLNTTALPLLALRLTVRFDGVPPSQRHAGEMWRGAMKAGLQRLAPDNLISLCEPETAARMRGQPGVPTNQVTPGFALRVEQPADGDAVAQQDQHVVITFFGSAAGHALAVMYALLDSATSGLGAQKLGFSLQQLERHVPGLGWQTVSLPLRTQGMLAHQWIPASVPIDSATAALAGAGESVCLSLLLSSRIVLEVRNARVRTAPSLGVLVEALAQRANRLGQIWGHGDVVTRTAQDGLCSAAAGARLLEAGAVRHERRRMRSGRQQATYPSDGLRGLFAYELPANACSELLPLLELGQWLHIGLQTTAGLGHYRLLVQRG